MNQTYGRYGSFGWTSEDASAALRSLVAQGFNTAAEVTGSATRGAQSLTAAAANRAAVITGAASTGASYLSASARARAAAAAHDVWCRTHPWECFKEKYPNWKYWALGIGGLYAAFVVYNLYMLPRRVRRAASYAAPLADAGLFGPEGMVAAQGARRAGLVKNRRRSSRAFVPHRRRHSKR